MANPIGTARGRVFFKKQWNAAWEAYANTYPVRCLRGCAPIEQNADIVFEYGDIKRENTATFAVEASRDFRDLYVKIEIYDADVGLSSAVAHWHGIVVSQTKADQGGLTATATGRQNIQAVGMEHILDRIKIIDSRALQDGEVVKTEWVPPFNIKYDKGHRIKGNRSKSQGPNSVYIFDRSSKAEVWNHQQIAEYLLEYFSPDWPPFTLTGQKEALAELEEVHYPRSAISLWDWLNLLIDRRRGVGFKLEPNSDESVIEINVFSLVNEAITVGDRTLPANAMQTNFVIPSTFPDTHLVEPIKFTKTTAGVYDVVEARGERMLWAGTLAMKDLKLQLDSTKAQRDKYIQDDDDGRTMDKYDGVWNRFVLNANWNYNISSILGVACNESAYLECDDDGNVSAPPPGNNVWGDAIVLERSLPFKRNCDYQITNGDGGPVVLMDDKDRPEFLPTQVFIKLPEGEIDAGKWRLADRMGEGETGLANLNVRVLDTKAGFELGCSPRHLFALKDWPKDANGAFTPDPKQLPRLDYHDVAATVAFRTDRRLKVIRNINPATAHESERRLVIEVPGCEYWYAVRGTVVEVDGGLGRIHSSLRVLRDDSDILRGVAAFAQGWYSVERQTVQIFLKKIDNYVALGSLLTQVAGQYNEPVNTVLSSCETDFRSGTIEYQSGWGEFDLIGGMLDERRGLASRRANEVGYIGDAR